jgi:hypothetical protein
MQIAKCKSQIAESAIETLRFAICILHFARTPAARVFSLERGVSCD